MIEPKKKPCKAIGKAKGSGVEGCGEVILTRVYGLCPGCYSNFLLNTTEGQEKLKRSALKATGSTMKELIRSAEATKRTFKIEDMSPDKYRASQIQPKINLIARLIDKGQSCIANPGRTTGKMAGGHRHSVGHNRTLALNLHNIHIQSYESNDKKAGDHIKYRAGVKQIYGVDYADFIDEDLVQCPPLKLTKQELQDLLPKVKKIIKRLESLNLTYTPKQRIRLRNEINKELGIYSDRFAVF